MRTSPLLIGLLGGLLLALVLAGPLYLALPADFLADDWPVPRAPWSLIGLLGSVGVVGLTGAAASWLDRDDSVRAASGAGALAALLGAAVIASPSAAVEACSGVLQLDWPTAPEAELLAAMTSSILEATWRPLVWAFVMVIIGSAVGALGGAAVDLYLGVGSRRAVRLVHRSTVPMWGLAALGAATCAASAWAGHLEHVMWQPLSGSAPEPLQQLQLGAPILAGGVASALMITWAMRDVALLWRSKLKVFSRWRVETEEIRPFAPRLQGAGAVDQKRLFQPALNDLLALA